MPCDADPLKRYGGPAVLGHPSLHQPVGDSVATAAAISMAGALGSAQTANMPNQIGLQNPSFLGTDPLTRHLAKMSMNQLTEILSELKVILSTNQPGRYPTFMWRLLNSVVHRGFFFSFIFPRKSQQNK